MTDIKQYLANQLSNDFITFEVAINQGEAAPHVWNQREVLIHMIEQSPNMRSFVDEFGLSLS